MTNERHEKALEAAVVAFLPERLLPETMHDAISRAIAAYLQAMGAAICEANPIAFEVTGPKEIYEPTFHRLTGADKEAGFSERPLHRVLPNHFTNGE